MLPLVSQISRPQQSVHNRVNQNIPVAMPNQSPLKRHLHPTQNQPPPHRKPVGVKTNANAEVHNSHSE